MGRRGLSWPQTAVPCQRVGEWQAEGGGSRQSPGNRSGWEQTRLAEAQWLPTRERPQPGRLPTPLSVSPRARVPTWDKGSLFVEEVPNAPGSRLRGVTNPTKCIWMCVNQGK